MALRFLLLVLFLILTHPVNSASTIKFLPGFEGPLPFELETGYIGIGEKEEVQSFYYFVKSEKNPEEDPLLIWLNGGPGCSSLTGLFLQNGPLTFKVEAYNGTVPTLISTTYSWTKVASIIYLDQPVGAGFSYYKTPIDEKVSDTGEAKRVHEFIQKWLSKHPQFRSNPFYVTGDSYAGMVIPALVQEISRGNYICCKPPINLQGYLLGNPVTHIEFDGNYRVPFAHGMALISDELYKSLRRICKGKYENADPQNKECLKLVEEYHKCTHKINRNNILTPDCDGNKVVPTSPDCYYYVYYIIEYWANNESVRESLHVRKGTVKGWERCTSRIKHGHLYNHDIISSVPYHKNNSINGIRSLIYSGDHDMTIPFQGTQAWIKSLNYSITDDWRPWMIKDQIAGYTRKYSNKMTYATIKGCGHTVEYKPGDGFIMFQRWINGQNL